MAQPKGPLSGFSGRFPTMTDITRAGKSVEAPRLTVGGAGHHPNRGARTAATDGTQKPSKGAPSGK